MKNKYLFAFDLHRERHSDAWTKIEEEVQKRYPSSLKVLNTTYIIVTLETLDTVNSALKAIIEKHAHDHEHVVCLFTEIAGWLKKPKWDWYNRQ